MRSKIITFILNKFRFLLNYELFVYYKLTLMKERGCFRGGHEQLLGKLRWTMPPGLAYFYSDGKNIVYHPIRRSRNAEINCKISVKIAINFN